MTRECLWNGGDVQQALGVAVASSLCVAGAEISSRDCVAGDMFFALKGAVTDGHNYVKDAFDHGAVAAIVSQTPEGIAADDPRLIRVDDVFEALYAMARFARARFTGALVGVTGSAGKTSTKEALARSLSRTAKTHKSLKSYNNHVGLPLSLVRMPADCAYAVLEMGMSKADEIRTLSILARPHMAIITSIGGAHHENFASLADIARAKAEIFEGLESGGAALIDGDGDHATLLASIAEKCGARVHKVSFDDEGSLAHAVRVVLHEHCSCVVADVAKVRFVYKVGLPGRHWAKNSLLALAAVHLSGGDMGLAGLELADLDGLDGRGARTRVVTQMGAFMVADESYNANPLSMAASLEVLGLSTPSTKHGERIAVLADMRELGAESEKAHMALADHIVNAGVTRLFTLGPAMNAMRHARLPHMAGHAAESVDDIIQHIKRTIKPGDVVLVKGSNAFGLSRVVDALKSLHEDGSSLWVDVAGAAE